MSYNRRQPRQGVRYGPPRERERYSENGVIVGRLVGLGILLLTLGVLAAGALAFVDDRSGPAVSTSRATRTVTATSSGLTATAPPSVATSLVAGPTATLVPATFLVSPPPSGQPPLVQIGPGYVTFGTRANRQLRILDPAARFELGSRVVWSAHLAEPADSVDLRIHVLKLDGTPPSGERLILDEALTIVVRDAQIFQRRILPAEVLDGPGVYVVRYVRGTEILSQGSLEITN